MAFPLRVLGWLKPFDQHRWRLQPHGRADSGASADERDS